MVNGILHDLSNALAPVILSADHLGSNGGDIDRKLVMGIKIGAKHCAGLVSQLLAFVRGVGGQRNDLDLKLLVSNFTQFIGLLLPSEVQIETEFLREISPVPADITQLQQVLLNLCINARDAMPKGGKISIKVDQLDCCESPIPINSRSRPSSYAVLSVIDTGRGIPCDNVDRVFEPFFSTKEFGRGTGLGLSTVREIVVSHGGFVTVESQLGKGSTFRIFLPVSPSQKTTALSADNSSIP
jgi:signal transduction histidine kinase